MTSLEKIILNFEKKMNWSLKDDKFVEIPPELRGMDLSFLWEELDDMGYLVVRKWENKVPLVKVVRKPIVQAED